MTASNAAVLRLADVPAADFATLLGRYRLELRWVAAGASIPGSYWGDVEAGLVGAALLVRADTPVHSALHEASHFICASTARRATLHRDAGGDDAEECAVCYLQILLAAQWPAVGAHRLMCDMDRWGYSFRLGSTAAWFRTDAQDARQWLRQHGLIDEHDVPTGRVRC